MAATADSAFGWDDEVEVGSTNEYTTLTPGVYTYRVDGFERGQFNGSTKMPACPMATLDLACANAAGQQSTVTTRLYLTHNQAWKISRFFKSCRLIDEDASPTDHVKYPWDKVRGAVGRVEISNREYNGKTYNDVKRFLLPSQDVPVSTEATEQQPSESKWKA